MSVTGPMVKMPVSLVHYLNYQTIIPSPKPPTPSWAPPCHAPQLPPDGRREALLTHSLRAHGQGVGGAALVQSRVRLPLQASQGLATHRQGFWLEIDTWASH